MNPAMEMDVPDGTEDTKPEFVPPVDVNDQKFIDLAKKMKNLSPETLSMIQKDLQPKEDPKEDSKEDPKSPEDMSKVDPECPCDKPDCKDCSVPSKDPRAMLIIGLKKVLSQV